MFGCPHQVNIMTPKSPMAIGCKTKVPTAWASRPVVKGATAPPELPKALMTPSPLTWWPPPRGRLRAKTAAAQG